jgi:hypothetical protein
MSMIRTPITKEQVLAGLVTPQTLAQTKKPAKKKKFVNVDSIIHDKPSTKVLKKWLQTNIDQIEEDQNVLTLYSQ